MAETEGFEPSIPISGYAHLANECLQPLGHVSGALDLEGRPRRVNPILARRGEAAALDVLGDAQMP